MQHVEMSTDMLMWLPLSAMHGCHSQTTAPNRVARLAAKCTHCQHTFDQHQESLIRVLAINAIASCHI